MNVRGGHVFIIFLEEASSQSELQLLFNISDGYRNSYPSNTMLLVFITRNARLHVLDAYTTPKLDKFAK